MAEGLITSAIEVGESSRPLLSNILKDIWGNRELGGASIDNCWVRGVHSGLLHRLTSIEHTLSLEGPSTKPVLEILECLESFGAVDDLGGIIASKQGIRSLAHFFRCYREGNHSSVNDTVIFQ